jgi:hypothetical protein
VVTILIMRSLQDQQQSFKELLLIFNVFISFLCFIISISKFKSGFHPVVYFSLGISGSYLLLFLQIRL